LLNVFIFRSGTGSSHHTKEGVGKGNFPAQQFVAMNLSSTYNALGDMQNRDAWLDKAKGWAPKGSPVYKYFHPNEE